MKQQYVILLFWHGVSVSLLSTHSQTLCLNIVFCVIHASSILWKSSSHILSTTHVLLVILHFIYRCLNHELTLCFKLCVWYCKIIVFVQYWISHVQRSVSVHRVWWPRSALSWLLWKLFQPQFILAISTCRFLCCLFSMLLLCQYLQADCCALCLYQILISNTNF